MELNTRVKRWTSIWYVPNVHMTREEYLYIGALALAWLLAWNLGLLIGWIILLTI